MLGDRYRLYQVFVNLLTNAIKYSPDGGKITIRGTEIKQSAEIRIKDQGIGIAKEHQKKIFQRLYQVSEPGGRTYPGLGIGLYISKEIVEQHGGTIEVESSRGKGSTFIVTLPLVHHNVRDLTAKTVTKAVPDSPKPAKHPRKLRR